MILRPYEADKDGQAALGIWHEIGWTEKEAEGYVLTLLEAGRTWVAELDGQAECIVGTAPGTIRYLETQMPFSCVRTVATSRIARKRGLASRLTAKAVAADAAAGALVCGLGMFEQGFYNQLGFGAGGYEVWMTFDPAQLNLEVKARLPRRITAGDWQAAHAARLTRMLGHGGCNLTPAGITKAEMASKAKAFGLGYFDGPKGELTHYFWAESRHPEGEPCHIGWICYQTRGQFLELMALIKTLSDQIRSVRMREPPGIQLQDMLTRPFRHRDISSRSKHAGKARARAYWQMRICDLAGCMAQTHLASGPVRFNLELTDPIARFLDEEAAWRGIDGQYVITAGPESHAAAGADAKLPTLSASVGAFTRLWLGVRPATGLAVTDELSGPPELLAELDRAFCLPQPKPDWDF